MASEKALASPGSTDIRAGRPPKPRCWRGGGRGCRRRRQGTRLHRRRFSEGRQRDGSYATGLPGQPVASAYKLIPLILLLSVALILLFGIFLVIILVTRGCPLWGRLHNVFAGLFPQPSGVGRSKDKVLEEATERRGLPKVVLPREDLRRTSRASIQVRRQGVLRVQMPAATEVVDQLRRRHYPNEAVDSLGAHGPLQVEGTTLWLRVLDPTPLSELPSNHLAVGAYADEDALPRVQSMLLLELVQRRPTGSRLHDPCGVEGACPGVDKRSGPGNGGECETGLAAMPSVPGLGVASPTAGGGVRTLEIGRSSA
mmetsp:Transcript_18035/g.40640  ORF Transcript_18035/g.40640 Transcript_18035/m.40640 type:complete len:313 (-) Transcript_18035:6-944(-)